MRNYPPRNYFKMLLISAAITGFISCKKETQSLPESNPQQEAIVDQATINNVNAWLDEKKAIAIKDDSKTKIQLLKDNLVFSKLKFEEYKNGEKFIVIPISRNFTTVNNKDKNPGNYLLLTLENTGKIRKGNIVQYVPANRQTNEVLATNSFNKIFNYKEFSNDATFTFLSITDDLQYAIKFENGKVSELNILKQKEKPSDSGNDGSRTQVPQCYSVFWVTYYPDGSSNWEFLYSFCEGECQTTKVAAGLAFRLNCFGGGGEGEPEYELEVHRTKEWTVTSNPINPAGGEIKSLETIKGRRNSSEPQGGHFTQITHGLSACNFCSSNNPGDVWSETSNTVAVSSAQSAISTVTGNLNYRGIPYNGINNTKTWSFQEVFP